MEDALEFVVGGLVVLAAIWFFAAIGRESSDQALHRELGSLLSQAKLRLDQDDMSRLRTALIELEVIADAQVATRQLSVKAARRALMKASVQTIRSYMEIDRMFAPTASR